MRTAIGIVLGLMVAVGLAVIVLVGRQQAQLAESVVPAVPDERADRAAIHELIRRTQDANNAGDVDAWLAGFAPDAVYLPPGSPAVSDPAALRAIAESGFSGAEVEIALAPDEIEVHGDWAFARIRVEGRGTTVPDGAPFEIDMKQIVLYERQPDGTWKIARLITNRNTHG